VKFVVSVVVPVVALTVAVVVPLGVPPVPPPFELLPPPPQPAHATIVANTISAKAVLQRGWCPRNPISASPAHKTQASRVTTVGVHFPGLRIFDIGNDAVAGAVVTVIVTVWLSVPGVRVTDAGLVAGVVAKVHDANDGSTGHWNPDTTIEPDVRFEAVTVSVKDCELPCATVNVGLDAVIEKLGPNWLMSAKTFGVPSPVAKS
jgi:hypothetical protein